MHDLPMVFVWSFSLIYLTVHLVKSFIAIIGCFETPGKRQIIYIENSLYVHYLLQKSEGCC